MGYYTNFALNIHTGNQNLLESPEFKAAFCVVTDYDLDILPTDTIKWYNSTDNMCTLSELFPNTIFQLEGTGEEDDDRWIYFYMNGKELNSNLREIHDPPTEFIDILAKSHPEYSI